MSATDDVRTTVASLRRSVAQLHRELTRYQPVMWTAANVSARVPLSGPSSPTYDDRATKAVAGRI